MSDLFTFIRRAGSHLYTKGNRWTYQGDIIAENLDVRCAPEAVYDRPSAHVAPTRCIKATVYIDDWAPYEVLVTEPAWREERARRDEIADGAEHDVEQGR